MAFATLVSSVLAAGVLASLSGCTGDHDTTALKTPPTPKHVALYNLSMPRAAVGATLVGPVGVTVYARADELVGDGVAVQLSVTSGGVTIDRQSAVTDARSVALFGALHLPTQAGVSTVRIRVGSTVDTTFSIEAVEPASTFDGDYDLRVVDGHTLPALYLGVEAQYYTYEQTDSVTQATLAIRGARYALTSTLHSRTSLGVVRSLSDVSTGTLVSTPSANGVYNVAFIPDSAPRFVTTTTDRNIGIASRDGRLLIRQDLPYAWPLWSTWSEFIKR